MRRAYFKFSWIAAALLAPQLLIIFVFFYWPSAQALYWAFTLEQPWGGGNTWVGFDNFRKVLSDPYYWGSVRVSVIYALATTVLAMTMALMACGSPDEPSSGGGIGGTANSVITPLGVIRPIRPTQGHHGQHSRRGDGIELGAHHQGA